MKELNGLLVLGLSIVIVGCLFLFCGYIYLVDEKITSRENRRQLVQTNLRQPDHHHRSHKDTAAWKRWKESLKYSNDSIPFSYSLKKIRNTTSSILPQLYERYLKPEANEQSYPTDERFIQEKIEKLRNFLSPGRVSSDPEEVSHLATLLAEGNHQPEIKLASDPLLSLDEYKRVEEKKNKEYLVYDENYLKELFDIIILIEPHETQVIDLLDWKPLLEQGFHCIFLQKGDSKREVTIPNWLEYELYTLADIDQSFAKLSQKNASTIRPSYHSQSDLFHGQELSDWTILNYALLVSDRDYIYFLNRNTIPDFSKFTSPVELLRIHAYHLLTPSLGNYYNYQYNPFHRNYDFIQGFPYSQRQGIETVMSMGTIQDIYQMDSLTRLVKHYPSLPTRRRLSRTKFQLYSFHEQENFWQKIEDHYLSQTIPKGMLFSLSFDYLAISRKAMGSLFCFLSGDVSKSFGERYTQILMGWILKIVLDQMHYGVKQFDSSPYLQRRSDSLNTINTIPSVAKNTLYDLTWSAVHETWYQSLLHYHPSPSIRDNPDISSSLQRARMMYLEIILVLKGQSMNLRSNLPTIDCVQVLVSLESLMKDYFHLWDLRHDFSTSFLPISSRNSFFSSSISRNSTVTTNPMTSHNCAVMTITYNDIEMLKIWIRYFVRHFPPSDIYVLNHHSHAVKDPERIQQYEQTIIQLEQQYQIRIIDLFGEKTGFPMMYFIRTADLYQRRLYRYGYQCTILTDTDEIIIADPDTYPDGLKQYLNNFVKDDKKSAIRAHGHIIGQLSTIIPNPSSSNGKKKIRKIDAPLDWNRNIFTQRNYWAVQPKYSKPVLSRIPVRHYPGFHNLYYPKPVRLDSKLILVHLRDVDATYCQYREYMKAMIVQNTSFQSELQKGLSTHLVHYQEKLARGEVCPYSHLKYFLQNNTVYDNTMEFLMKMIPPRFRKVII